MGAWSKDSKSHVAHMASGDFYGNELSASIAKASVLRIEHTDAAGKITVLKDGLKVKDAELIGATVLNVAATARVPMRARWMPRSATAC